MSWFTSGSSALDEQVEKATASSLEDMALNLEISDLIRSKAVQPKDAMVALKKRVGNKNPNIQLATLNLTDTCVKNGGSHFLEQIASREYLDNLVSLLKAPGATNHAVQQKILEVIQTWSHAFEGKHNLQYVDQIYKQLKAEGYDFPRAPKLASAFVDSSAPPDWTDSDVCMRCRTAFTFTNRKHHCRNCGSTFCGACSSKSIPLPRLGVVQAVRVCDGCYAKLKNPGKLQPNPVNSDPYKQRVSSKLQPRNARIEEDDDEDLKMALKMSLEEVQGSKHTPAQSNQRPVIPTSSRPEPPRSNAKPAAPQRQSAEEEEDEELKAAIAASLRDMEEQKAKSAWSNPAKASAAANTAITRRDVRPDHELTPTEAENINLFATLVDRLQTAPPGTILREPQIQELYESIGSLRPKLARTFGETMSKYEALCDLHAKLATVVRYYDKMLEERLQATYGRHGMGDDLGHPPNNANYPTLPSAEAFYGRPTSTAPNYPPQSTAPNYPPSSAAPGYPPQNYQSYYTQPQNFNPQAYPGSPAPSNAPPAGPAPQNAPQGPSQPPQEYQHAPSQPSYPPTSQYPPEQPQNQPSYPPSSQYPPEQRPYQQGPPPHSHAPPSEVPQQNPPHQQQQQQAYNGPPSAVSSPQMETPHPLGHAPQQQPSQPPYWQQYQKPPGGEQPAPYAYPQLPGQQPGWGNAPGQRPAEHQNYGQMQYPAEAQGGAPGGAPSQPPQQQPRQEEVSLIEL